MSNCGKGYCEKHVVTYDADVGCKDCNAMLERMDDFMLTYEEPCNPDAEGESSASKEPMTAAVGSVDIDDDDTQELLPYPGYNGIT